VPRLRPRRFVGAPLRSTLHFFDAEVKALRACFGEVILTFLILLSRHFLNAPRATLVPPTGVHLKDCPWMRVTLVRVLRRRVRLRARRAMFVTP